MCVGRCLGADAAPSTAAPDMTDPDSPTPSVAPALAFDVAARHGDARAGMLHTAHGVVRTPAFVAVGRQAGGAGVPPDSEPEPGTQLLFANTYHPYRRPGAEVGAAHGGLHRFMNWDRPILPDSGGFQVSSLGASIEHGVGKIASIFPGE